ncbi:uncharacterized protein si:ch211-14k19.8 [Oncorhynchus kisutch]|uniref:uncharacterized protein si:ch211-14k19.8 n=2 Tax=Oncorhynchus TaxID=8016 RepID=UPI0012DEB18A|nr:uncharacterized protein LOC109887401 [Oncorhynchus kisutch]
MTSTMTTDSESQWPETDTHLLSHTHATHAIQTHTPLLDMSPAHTPLSQTPVLSSTAVSPPSPLNPIQEHNATHPDHSVLTPTPTALTSPSGPNTTPLYPVVTTSPVVTTTTTTQPSLTTKQPSTTTTQPSTTTTQPPLTTKQPSTTTTQPISSTQSFPRLRTTRPPPWSAPHPSQGSPSAGTSSGLSPSPPLSTISSTHRPRVFILPDRPATIKEESIELLLQVILEESSSDPTSSLEDDTISWVAPYLQRAPGFQDLQGVWSSGRAVQSVVVFRTSGALAWLGVSGAGSLLERTGLAQAVREGRSFRGSKVTNVTVGGVQDDVCLWLFNCPAAGFECLSRPGHMAVCSSVCHSDYCHNQGICTHHPHQPPLCQCPVGDHFWFMGRRCDVRMTQQRLVGACLGVLVAIVTLIGAVAWLAVRRYRAMLIKTKVDQTRSSYRRFNHFDELSGRFWGRSIGGSADSLDNPVFTRSDELLHRRALDRTCCYHDDTLSLASTCPSNGTHLNTVYPHNSQYGWAVSEVSLAECVLDSGKASDLSVCSWPIEPIQWTPFPLLQQLSSTHRTTPVRALRPRSYCEGMELVELEKSWTA